jgi:peptidoglycan DL-endopeptidase CwlO
MPETKETSMRARNDLAADGGQIHVALAAGLGGLLLLIAVLLGAGSSIDQQNTIACQIQPAATNQATTAIPANYLNLYRKAGQQYQIAWNLLAAIGKIESDHGRDPGSGVHSGANVAGAAGPMQIGVGGAAGNNWGGTPRHRADAHAGGYGTNGNRDGWDDVYDPADAIPAAARMLKAHGAPANIRTAIFAYNHSNDYVNHVLHIADTYASHGVQAIAAADTPACEQAALGPLPPTTSRPK